VHRLRFKEEITHDCLIVPITKRVRIGKGEDRNGGQRLHSLATRSCLFVEKSITGFERLRLA
jgi:hypothetical protein